MLLTFGLALGSALAFACAASPGATPPVDIDAPPQDQFIDKGVSGFLEARCGAIDCHGQVGRPLRLYSANGLRRDVGDGGGRDTSATTRAERVDNWRSVVGLDPEEMNKSQAANGDPGDLMLMKKPLDIEFGGVRHKGGPVLRASPSDPGWLCLLSWLARDTNQAACTDATF
ncbi:MAG: hypothetical protein KC657_19385 [Myxococcales bacterium]|nr:hypothetical protein [Myxococcales bacterium]